MLSKELSNNAVDGGRTLIFQTKDDDSQVRMCSSIENFSKVKVKSEDDPLFLDADCGNF